ncbi:acetolactate synthase 2 catalytic subunit [Parvularcula marina]|uniref:Acetolactate synthase n=1 Tax=Parvularcula marina TaxID=2292771 RepID=A0A371RKS3_9PROT|nr:acetolactate synthase 2 catalytic subunit [Parvularcula marina]RFB06041.1 acetolactate synthase 2 catalytic subunit [Parvularcula marina]
MNTATAQAPTPAPEILRGADLVVRALEAQGVTTVFGYPGGAIMPVYDALPGSSLKHILCRHEQGAAFAAAGWSRMTGKAGVCFATSGPGATNLVTGIADAFMDSVPMVAITGQVAEAVMGTDAFQEIDTFGVTMPVVKHSYIVRNAAELPEIIAEAFRIAEEGRPGPVLVDIPKDIQLATADVSITPPMKREELPTDVSVLDAAREAVRSAKRPLFYLGGGIVRSGATEDVRRVVEETGIPAVATLQAQGVLPTGHEQFLGMLGMHGSRAANLAVQSTDLLIVVGARFDDRATGRLNGFAPEARVIHFDRDISEISKLRDANIAVPGELKDSVTGFNPGPCDVAEWCSTCYAEREASAPRYDAPGEGIFAPAFLKQLSEAAGDDFVGVADVGQHQMWIAQHCRFSRPQAHLTSGGLGSMGFSLPTAMGAKMSEPSATVVSISGDGGFMMNVQELATIRRYQIPVKIVVINNSRLGMVRQWQELFFEENYSEVDLSDNPDFAVVAQAFGIEGFTITKRDEVPGAIDRLLKADGPILCHVVIDPADNVWPLVPPGATNAEMLETSK